MRVSLQTYLVSFDCDTGDIPPEYEISSCEEAVPFLKEIFKTLDADKEHFIVLGLDPKLKVLNYKVVATGYIGGCPVHPREVFSAAIELRSTSLIISHNHPTGNVEPSNEDIHLTRKLKECGGILGIPILDHIIMTPFGEFKSLINLI